MANGWPMDVATFANLDEATCANFDVATFAHVDVATFAHCHFTKNDFFNKKLF